MGRAAVREETKGGVAVSAAGLELNGSRGTVFRDVAVEAGPGALIAVDGPSGSGRSCLLLTLTGRMRPTGGHAEVGGHRLPRRAAAVRRFSALGPVPGVTDLEPALTVAEHLRERALLQRRFGAPLRALLTPRRERTAAARARLDTALAAAGLDLDALPKGPRTRVRDLDRLEAFRLGTALALTGEPRLLAVDDVGFKLPADDCRAAWSVLYGVAAAGTTVLAVGTPPPPGGGAPEPEPAGGVVTVRTGRPQADPEAGTGRTADAEAADADADAADADAADAEAADAPRTPAEERV
ncbi:ATP-binding cassette domain-containing protein [Streptomyces armeniacus]|uniref:ATP-binding cassette domain-containing protein n=1 Tax=Streptomyces armeniacus TaxID=83291 RepID=A0A345XLW7_9ACTN|nr:ATP-binding cassette domain-containing protein [Streptomyces armeniacus]AXK32633.1 ATP-binding cassette domain-containing protein [Streptomyces armeniacus]